MHNKSGHTSMVLLFKCECTPYSQSTGQWLLNGCKLENDSNQFVLTSLYLCELLKQHHKNPLCFIMNKISRMANFIFYFYLSTCVAFGSFVYQWYSMWWLFTFYAFKEETQQQYFTKVFWQLVPNTVGPRIKRIWTLKNDEITLRMFFKFIIWTS